jgi:hypothetical protein
MMLLETGAPDAEVSAVTGQSREMIEHCSTQANQRKLAAAAILKVARAGSSIITHEHACCLPTTYGVRAPTCSPFLYQGKTLGIPL